MSRSGKHGIRALILLGAVLILLALAVAEALLNAALAEESSKPWASYIAKIDEALTRRDVGTAVRTWHDAYSVALGSRHWEGMLEVGDAYLRIGEVSGFRKGSEPRVRQMYLTALFRARAQRSVDGVLRIAQAFTALGDRDVARQCLRIADGVAAVDGTTEMRARVVAFATRFYGEAELGNQFPP